MRDGFARGQEYSQAHPAYAAMQDVHIGDWDCDVCAETFTSVPFFACASFEDCVFRTRRSTHRRRLMSQNRRMHSRPRPEPSSARWSETTPRCCWMRQKQWCAQASPGESLIV